MTTEWLGLIESNTTGSGRLFCTKARDLGLRPVVFTRQADRYPYLRLDDIDVRTVDTTDPAAVLRACVNLVEQKGGRIAGVTSSSEYFITTASEVARQLGLPHADPEALSGCRDKFTQRTRLRNSSVLGPEFAEAGTSDEAVLAAERIGLPVVVKPRSGSGSIGVRMCTSLASVKDAAADILQVNPVDLALPPQSSVMVEEYVDGIEYSVETMDTTVIGITRKHLGPEPHFVEIGHDFPAVLEAMERETVSHAAIRALRALGLGWGAAHIELRLARAGCRVIEVNPRLAGGMIPRLIEEAYGIDLVLHVVAKATGQELTPRPTRALASSIRFLLAGRAGRFLDVRGVEEAQGVAGVVAVGVNWKPEHKVTIRNSFQDRAAYVIAVADHTDAAAHASESGLAALSVRFAL
ncbi:ATP-grasp domain-containing protein [Streptomyces canus]|nr:ATP-grasp domain-containing protein [Streptomyces canus]